MKKGLVVCYSWSNGNTLKIAEKLAEQLHADLRRIETIHPYEGSYDDVVRKGQQEVENGFQPDIRSLDVSVSDYDFVAVGTPTWWYTMAPAVLSFLKSQDWKGKKVIPFMTNGGWPGHVISDMEKKCSGAEILCPKEIRFDSEGGPIMKTPEKEIDAWISDIREKLEEQ